MIMKAKKKIKDIPFGLFNNLKGIYLKKENKVLFIDNDQNEGLTFDFPFILENVNDKFIFIRNKESIKMFSLDYKLVNEFYFKNIGSKQVKFIDNNNIYLREKADDRWGFSKLSIKGNYIWTIDSDQDFLVSSLSDNFLLIKQDKSLKVIDTNNGKTFWQKDFKSLLDGFDIVQYGEILTIKDKIYVYLADDTNSDNSATVCINQNTGDVLDVYYGFAGNLMLHNEELIVASYKIGRAHV